MKGLPKNFARPSDLRAQNRVNTEKLGSLLGKGAPLEESGRSVAMSVTSGFASAKGSVMQFSRQKEEAMRKLCLEEDEVTDHPPPRLPLSRKRSLGNVLSEKRQAKGFKTPRLKPALEAPKRILSEQSPGLSPVNRRSTFSEYGSQDSAALPSKRASFVPPRGSNDRRVTLASVKERQLSRRYTKGWRPTSSISRVSGSEEGTESPLQQLALGRFNAESALSPIDTAAHVFSNGASALSLYSAMIDSGLSPTLSWVKQQYRWIVWQLSGIAADGEAALTADNVFSELKHRFSAETTQNRRLSVLEELPEGRTVEAVVVVVGDVPQAGDLSTKLELSDGFSSLIAEIDSGLQERCKQGEMQPGALLFVEGLKIQKSTSGSLEMQLQHNSCLPVSGDTPLGRARQGAFFLPLSRVDMKGGPIPTTLLCISRKYPVLFQHKNGNGELTYLTQRQHQRKLDSYRNEIEQIESTAKTMVQEEETKYFKSVLEMHREGQNVPPTELLYAQCILSDSENETLDVVSQEKLEKFREEHKKTLEGCLKRQMAQLRMDWGTTAPEELPHLPLEVTEISRSAHADPKPAHLKVSLRGNSTGSVFEEGDVFEFKNLSPEAEEGPLIFHAGSQSSFRKICSVSDLLPGHVCYFIPRSPVPDFTALQPGALVDLEAFLVPQSQSEHRFCIPLDNSTSLNTASLLIAISDDPFEALSTVRCNQIWSLRDLQLISYSAENRVVAAKGTQKTACSLMKCGRQLEKLRKQYKQDRQTIDVRIKQHMDAL